MLMSKAWCECGHCSSLTWVELRDHSQQAANGSICSPQDFLCFNCFLQPSRPIFLYSRNDRCMQGLLRQDKWRRFLLSVLNIQMLTQCKLIIVLRTEYTGQYMKHNLILLKYCKYKSLKREIVQTDMPVRCIRVQLWGLWLCLLYLLPASSLSH